MKIFVPTSSKSEDSQVSDNLSRAPFFYIFDTEVQEGRFLDNVFLDNPHGVGIKIAEMIIKNEIDIVIAPRVGEKAFNVLEGYVKLYKSNSRNIKDNIADYLLGKLEEV